MTRKDFIFIADVIRSLPAKEAEVRARHSLGILLRDEIAKVFADRLGSTNPRFNRDLFVQAATGIVPLTARKPV